MGGETLNSHFNRLATSIELVLSWADIREINIECSIANGDAMDINDYQRKTEDTAIYMTGNRERDLMYLMLGLQSEVGEVSGLLKKHIRDGTELDLNKLQLELGDVFWYLSQLHNHYGQAITQTLAMNIQKLADRKARNVLGGSGDNR